MRENCRPVHTDCLYARMGERVPPILVHWPLSGESIASQLPVILPDTDGLPGGYALVRWDHSGLENVDKFP